MLTATATSPAPAGWALRPALAADAEVLARLCAEHAAYEQIPHCADGHAERLAQGLKAGRLNAWLGFLHGRAVGYASATLDYATLAAQPFLHLDCLYLDPAARGLGLGRALLDAAAEACRGGVARSHIVSYAEDGALLTELFTRDGGGTLVSQEQFEVVREATIEDVGGLLELISPLEEQGILVRRSREVLEREIEQFSVVEREGMIIACAALYQIADSDAGELACLAVNPEYRHGGRGDELLERIETRAREQGLKTLFVLTTRTAHWFRERGFEPSSVERLPAARASLYNYQRNSKIFEKAL